jgi:hypothetical protein
MQTSANSISYNTWHVCVCMCTWVCLHVCMCAGVSPNSAMQSTEFCQWHADSVGPVSYHVICCWHNISEVDCCIWENISTKENEDLQKLWQ